MSVDLFALSKATVYGEDGKALVAADLWKDSKAILIFLRHFACIACRAHASQVWAQRESYQKGGAKIIFIGNGAPHFIGTFKKDLGIEGASVYTDPNLDAFRACGFKRGFIRALSPRSLLNVRKLKLEGFTQGKQETGVGDLWQLGGVVVIAPDNKVGFHFISEATGDFPLEEDLKRAWGLTASPEPT